MESETTIAKINKIYTNALGDIDSNDIFGQGYLKALKEVLDIL